jgi:hypothetical protein
MLFLFFSHTELILLTGDSGSAAFAHVADKFRTGTNFVDVANSTCTYTNMPEVEIPDKYNTFGTVISLQASDTTHLNADANKTYDLLTRQTIPLVLLGRFADPESILVQSRVEFVCMTANKTVGGSRVPEQDTPWKSAGADISARMVGWAAVVVTAVMLML